MCRLIDNISFEFTFGVTHKTLPETTVKCSTYKRIQIFMFPRVLKAVRPAKIMHSEQQSSLKMNT